MHKLLLLFVGLAVTNGSHHFFYRKDYTYMKEFDSFYKFHWDPQIRSWTDAFKACDDEGAKLFYPKDDLEWTIVKNLTDSLATPLSTTDVIVGIRDQYGFGEFMTIDGQPMPIHINDELGTVPRCVYMEIDTGSYSVNGCAESESTPFVCKKVDETPCPTIDLDYVYYKDVKKCYKVNKRARSWQQAYHTCCLEGAMLAVIENDSEANQVQEIIESQKEYHAGFSSIENDYFTVTGKRFEKVYQRWYQDDHHNSQCGAVWQYDRILYTKTVNCNEILPFVCEMNPNVSV